MASIRSQCALMIALSRQLGLDDDRTKQAGLAGLLHDIGRMAVPADILQKPGKLTDAEFVSVKEHPQAGLRLLEAAKCITDIVRDVCLHHYEKWMALAIRTGWPARRLACTPA